ncbi:MAG: hypothetical protein MJE68_09170, partial [Proteobacteria bacterium]|nr:hypothetical protein [Pseudomonadota bacterium]
CNGKEVHDNINFLKACSIPPPLFRQIGEYGILGEFPGYAPPPICVVHTPDSYYNNIIREFNFVTTLLMYTDDYSIQSCVKLAGFKL